MHPFEHTLSNLAIVTDRPWKRGVYRSLTQGLLLLDIKEFYAIGSKQEL